MHDLLALFRFGVAPWELVLRGSAVYWFLFLLFRFVLRRDAGSMGIADILLLVLIADASQNAMAGGYETVTDGFVLVATIAGWNWLIDWSSYHVEAVRRFTEPPPLVLVRHGRMLPRNMRREYVTPDDLKAALFEQGVEQLSAVKIARMEANGNISVIRVRETNGGDNAPANKNKRNPAV